jgi:NADH/NAD ratio-sensing transcriptional regulator Rex
VLSSPLYQQSAVVTFKLAQGKKRRIYSYSISKTLKRPSRRIRRDFSRSIKDWNRRRFYSFQKKKLSKIQKFHGPRTAAAVVVGLILLIFSFLHPIAFSGIVHHFQPSI